MTFSAKRIGNLRGILLCGVSALSASVFAWPAVAQDQSLETVVVTGIRASLSSAQSIKQNSDTFVDSVTAEDIGALPDQSVTETLARIPGVSINRFAAAIDPDHFSAEGSGVVIQGLTYTKSTLNGRDTFTANNGRALSFADVPPELLVGVDVYKNQSADMIEGGISGTVNLRTRVPFDSQGLLIAGSGSANYGDFRHTWEPSFSALASDRWSTPIGEFGLLVNGVLSKLDVRADGDQASNFACRTDLGEAIATCPTGDKGVWFPRGAAFRSQIFNRERRGVGGAAQWQSPDGTWLATVQYLNSESRDQMTEHAIEIATDNVTSNGDSRPVAGTTFGFDSNGVFTKGIITGNTGWTDDTTFGGGSDCNSRGCDPRTPPIGLQSNNIRRDWDQHYVTNDIGGNLKWTPNETWAFNADFDHVYSAVNISDNGIWGSTDQNVSLNITGNYPVIHMLPPSPDGNIANEPQCTTYGPPGQLPVASPARCTTYLLNGGFSDPAYNYWRSAMDHMEHSRGTQDSLRFDVDYHFDKDGWLQLARAGVRWSDRVQTTRFSTYNWGVLSEQWGSGGPVWMSDPLPGVPQPAGNPAPAGSGPTSVPNVEVFPFSDFFRGQVPVPTGNQPRLFYNSNVATPAGYAAYAKFGLLVGDTWRPRYDVTNPCNAPAGYVLSGQSTQQNWVPLGMRCGAIPGTPFLPGEINPVSEITQEAYLMLKFGHEVFDGHSLSGNIGLRYFQIHHRSSGTISFTGFNPPSAAVCATPPEGGESPQPFCLLTPEQQAAYRQFIAGGSTFSDQSFRYDYFLPSINLRFDINDEMLLRFGASKAVSLPDVGFTRYFLTLGSLPALPGGVFGGLNATAGNPFLKPIRSNQFDISYEWYFAKVGSITAAAFYKELRGVITNGTQTTNFTSGGVTLPILATSPSNSSKTGTVRGFEVAVQRFFDFLPDPFDGFGVNVNYSYLTASGVPQNTLSNTDPNVAAGNVANVDTSKLPLQGLSKHNINAELIYEKGPFSTRLAYNWRSKFLLTPRDVIVPFAPIMNAAYGQLDGSFFYNITDQLKAGIEAVNILNGVVETDQVVSVNPILAPPRSFFITDRRITFTVRFQY